jgi:RHS repeat-associated protein
MRKTLGVFLGLAVGFLSSGLDISSDSSGDHSSWRVSLASPAHAQFNGSCEYPPVDEPDNDGDECNPNYSNEVNPPKNQGDPRCNGCGNPINFATGGKYEAETDYASVGPFPLVLTRYYNSQDAGVHKFGANWRGSYGSSLARTTSTVVTATRETGRVLTFKLTGGVWTPDADVNYRLTAAGSGWSLVTDQDETETYDANGRLMSFANRAGLTQTFSRDGQGRLVTATDPFGRTMTFTFASPTSPLITRMTAPDGGVYAYAYDAGSRLTSVTFPDGSRRQYVYENATFPTNVTGVIDENGNRFATFAYDSTGRATSSQHAGGADLTTVDYQYFSLGVASVRGPLGGVTSYLLQGINGTANQAQVNRSCSNCFSGVGGNIDNTFDANGNLVSMTDFNGNRTTYAFDTTRNLETSRTMAAGTSIARTITTTWHSTYRLPTRIVDGTRTVANSYDARGNLLSSTLTAPTLTSTRSFTYNGSGQVVTATDPRGNVTTYAYDARGNTTSVTNALGQATLFTSYDANGRPLSTQDPNGVVTTLTYNFRGQITSKTTLTRLTTYAYDAVGNLTRVTQPDGSFLAMTYDAAHRLIGIADALGNTTAYTLDAAGNRTRTQIFDPTHTLKQTHSRVFDGLGRLYQDIGAANQAFTFSYDNNDNNYFFYNPITVGTQNFFDALNRVTQTSKNGTTTSFGYDAKGRVNRVTDPRNLATNYTYDGLDDQTSIASPDTGATTTTYDAAGNLATSRDANGNTTTYSYDALNRVIRQTLASGVVISFQYDQGTNGIGRLTTMTDPTGATSWAYNRFGQVNLKQQTIGTVTLTTHWFYTANTGLLASITYPSGSIVSFAYNANGQANAVSYQPSASGASSALLSQIAYQPFGPVASWSNGNGTTYRRTYDQDGRVSALALPAGVNIALTYDAASRITGMTETGLAAKSFGYDSLDRLTSYTSGTLTQTYSYDAVGNRTRFTTNSPSSQTFTYQYASVSNRLTGISGSASESYAYDAAGNTTLHQTSLATFSFAYNARNRQNQATVGTSVKVYQIDGLGQRVAKLDSGVYQTLFSYDAAGHMMGRYSGNGSPIEETVWLGDLPVAVLVPGAQLFVAPDHLGAPHQITAAGGAVVWLWDHDPFGNGLPTGSFGYNLRFPGQFYDQQTGLHYNYFRDYDPAKGRYVESDPIGLAGGISTYGYAGGNPGSIIDALGLYLGADDAVAAGTGALLGVLFQGGSDLISWRLSSWQTYVGSAAGGAAGGEAFLYTGPIGAGLVGAAVRNATTQGLNIATDPCAKFDALSFAGETALGGLLGFGGQLLGKVAGPLGQWIRIGPSYSRSLDQRIAMSIRWGASTAKGGKYVNQIPNDTLRDVNQWLRAQQIPFSGWRGGDPGHFHLW